MNNEILIDFIQHPIITDKTTKLLEENQYSFAVNRQATKVNIKSTIEYIFKVKVKTINTYNTPIKKKRVGKFVGRKSKYKKAIITLHDGYIIPIFPNS